ncbi:MAG: hypothetical protein KC503_05825 [Myxococcales bacterium]|nr:hypothetical protein [Myxococcales bacterium]
MVWLVLVWLASSLVACTGLYDHDPLAGPDPLAWPDLGASYPASDASVARHSETLLQGPSFERWLSYGDQLRARGENWLAIGQDDQLYISNGHDIGRVTADGIKMLDRPCGNITGVTVSTEGVAIIDRVVRVVGDSGFCSVHDTLPRGIAARGSAIYGISGFSVVVRSNLSQPWQHIAGNLDAPGSDDGDGPSARFLYPHAIATDQAGRVIINDGTRERQTLRVITGRTVSSIALDRPTPGNVAVGPKTGVIYVSDHEAGRIVALVDGSTKVVVELGVGRMWFGFAVDSLERLYFVLDAKRLVRLTPGPL